MPSRLLARLDVEIASTTSALKADCLRIERAGLLARLGRLDEARQVLSSQHMRYASNPNATVSAWLSWGEALLTYFHDLGSAAHDKMKRAFALSGAVRDPKLQSLMGAWLALTEFIQQDFEAMAQHLSDVLRKIDPQHHAAQARASLVAAVSYHFAGRFDLAQPWYARCRQHATAEGDEATLSAVMHYMAWLHAEQAKRQILCDGVPATWLQHAELAADSAANFDALIGTAPLDALLPVMRAGIRSLQDRPLDAVALYERHLSHALAQGLDRRKSSLLADLAWCRASCGKREQSVEDVRAAESALGQAVQLEDRAVAHTRLGQWHRRFGDAERAATHEAAASNAWRDHAAQQARLVALLDQSLAHVLL
jgi:hypothetical protein